LNTIASKKIYKILRRAALDALLTMFLVALATVLSALIAESLNDPMQVLMIYVLMVLLVATATSGYLYGVFASIAAVMGVNYFFAYPYSAFNFSIAGYPITFGTLLVVSLTTSFLVARVKIQRRRAQEREHQNEALYELANQLFYLQSPDEIAEAGVSCLAELFAGGALLYLGNPAENRLFLKGDQSLAEEEAAIALCYKEKLETGRGTQTTAGASGCYLPIAGGEQIYGVAGIAAGLSEPESSRALVFLRLIVRQIAIALEYRKLEHLQQKAAVEAKTESMRGNLLRAISHDLRTPLTGIYGASSTILEQGDHLSHQQKNKMLSDISENASWMIRMVENLLTVTRIENNGLPIKKTPEAAEEIIGAAMAKLRKSFPDASVRVCPPDELLMVPMDGILIQQVLINLIENAIKYSKNSKPIEVAVNKKGDFALFTVIDDGVGISPEHVPMAFDGRSPTNKESADARRGIGIGLPICKTIVNAHGGGIGVTNQQGGGCCFYFSLPLEEAQGGS
jgi:two-component system sensor histidine kinase KdpD